VSPFFLDSTAIAGVGTTAFGALYRDLDSERSQFDLGAQAFVAAVEDSGLSRDDVDGVLVCRIPDYARMCEILGIRYPRFVNVMQAGGRMASLTVQYASLAIQAGLARVVACIYGNNGRSVGARYGGETGGGTDSGISDSAYGMTSPGAAVAHMFRRHQFLYGTPVEALGIIAINNRLNAALNPNAVMRSPITMEDYLSSRFVARAAAPARLLPHQRRWRLPHRDLRRARSRPAPATGLHPRLRRGRRLRPSVRGRRPVLRAAAHDRRRPARPVGGRAR
jgi:acetyl-CoA acetyltransferase